MLKVSALANPIRQAERNEVKEKINNESPKNKIHGKIVGNAFLDGGGCLLRLCFGFGAVVCPATISAIAGHDDEETAIPQLRDRLLVAREQRAHELLNRG